MSSGGRGKGRMGTRQIELEKEHKKLAAVLRKEIKQLKEKITALEKTSRAKDKGKLTTLKTRLTQNQEEYHKVRKRIAALSSSSSSSTSATATASGTEGKTSTTTTANQSASSSSSSSAALHRGVPAVAAKPTAASRARVVAVSRALSASHAQSSSSSRPPRRKKRTATSNVDALKSKLKEVKEERNALRLETETLKGEVTVLATQLKNAMTKSDDALTEQLQQLQQTVLEYQGKNAALKKEVKELKRGGGGGSGVDSGEKKKQEQQQLLIEALQRENDELRQRKDPDLSSLYKDLHAAKEAADRWRRQAEEVSEKQKRTAVAAPRQMTAKLNLEVANLTFQMFYGGSEKDNVIDALQQQAEEREIEAESVSKLKRKFGRLRDKHVESWLFSQPDGDDVEVL